MKILSRCLTALVAALLLPACDRSSPAVNMDAPVTKEELGEAFADAPAEVREAAEQAGSDAEADNAKEAFARLQALNEVSDLTPEQRQTLARSRNAVLKQLQTGAANGDQEAQQMLQHYQTTR